MSRVKESYNINSSKYCLGLSASQAFTIYDFSPVRSAERNPPGLWPPRTLNPPYDTGSSCRLGGLGDAREVAQDAGGAVEPLLGPLPFVEEHHLHVGPYASVVVLADEPDQCVGIGKAVVAEGDHRALGPGLDLLHIGLAAQRLDGDDLQELAHLLRDRAETVC